MSKLLSALVGLLFSTAAFGQVIIGGGGTTGGGSSGSGSTQFSQITVGPVAAPILQIGPGVINCAGNPSYVSAVCMQPVLSLAQLLGIMMIPQVQQADVSHFPTGMIVHFDGPSTIPAGMKGNYGGFGVNITTNQALTDTNQVDGANAFGTTIKVQNGGIAHAFGVDWHFDSVGNFPATNFAAGLIGATNDVAGQTIVMLRLLSQGTQPVTVAYQCQVQNSAVNFFSYGCFDAGGSHIQGVDEYHFVSNTNAAKPYYIWGGNNGIWFFGGTLASPVTNPFQFYMNQSTGQTGKFQVFNNSVDNVKLFEIDGTANSGNGAVNARGNVTVTNGAISSNQTGTGGGLLQFDGGTLYMQFYSPAAATWKIRATDFSSVFNDQLQFTSTGPIKIASTASFSANGTVATVLGSLGPVGSHTTVQTWLTFIDSGGTTRYVPAF